MNDDQSLQLSDEQINDVEETFNRLLQDVHDLNPDDVIRDALEGIHKHLEDGSLPDKVRDGLQEGKLLAEDMYPNDLEDPVHRIALTSLEYFRDPWDIIPDEISQYGLLDDAYVFQFAREKIDEVQNVQEQLQGNADSKSSDESEQEADAHTGDWSSDEEFTFSGIDTEVVLESVGVGGPHLASRAKSQSLLEGRQRSALFDIGRQKRNGEDLTPKQKSYLTTLIQDLVQQGLLQEPCDEQPCSICDALHELVEQAR